MKAGLNPPWESARFSRTASSRARLLTSVDEVRLARTRADLAGLGGDVVPLAGGTGLYAGASPRVLVDLLTLGWPPVTALPVRTTIPALL